MRAGPRQAVTRRATAMGNIARLARVTPAGLVLAFMVMSLLLLAATRNANAVASSLFVNNGSSNCSDSGSGTSSQPYCTIKKAATVAVAGQTVLVSSGTYGGDVVVSNSGTSSARASCSRKRRAPTSS